MATGMVHIRVDERVKAKAAKTLSAMGLTVSDAVRILLTRIASEKALPFEVRVPNRDTIAAMLNVADSAFQPRLQAQAVGVGKLESTFSLPAHALGNRPERIEAALGPARRSGLLPAFPLGSEMDEVEQALVGPLLALKGAGYGELLRLLAAGIAPGEAAAAERRALERLGLAAPATPSERAWRTLVLGALRRRA